MYNIFEYKGYHTKIEFISESKTLRGKIEGINDYVDFESDDLNNIEAEFHSAVDDYLEFCKEIGKEPEKEYKGSFNIRISPELHRKIAVCAFKEGCSLNSMVEKAITAYVDSNQSQVSALYDSIQNLSEKISMSYTGYVNETTINSKNIIPFESIKHSYSEEVKVL